MEGEKLFANWQQQGPVSMSEIGSTLTMTEQLHHPGLLHLNWDQALDQSSHFGSALSSMVSSPSHSTHPSGDSVVIHELIGRLGSICNSGEISPPSHPYGNPCAASCYSTPLNSPPKLNISMVEHHKFAHPSLPIPGNLSAHLAPFPSEPGFGEQAARLVAFGEHNYAGQIPLPESGKLSRASSSKSIMMSRPSTPEEGREESSVSGAVLPGIGESNGRKRKAGQRSRGNLVAKDLPKVAEEEDVDGKKNRSVEGIAKRKDELKAKGEVSGDTKSDDCSGKPGKENVSKLQETPKQDYIHVRARRGQATDSHSLAERVRREKISERMKFLQNLVPGCNKVTGKAVMLDEIINYVQSLQRQVEFLSMKLATLNPRMDFGMDGLFPKEMIQSRGSIPHSGFPTEVHSSPVGFPFQFPQPPSHGSTLQSIVTNGMESHGTANPMDASIRPPFSGIGDAHPQIGAFWEDDLHGFVQMSYCQNQELPTSSQTFQGSLPASTHMKVEH